MKREPDWALWRSFAAGVEHGSLSGAARAVEFARLQAAASRAADLGLEVHAGHGLDYETAADMVAIPELRELNIGHFLIGEAVFVGLATAIHRMRAAIDTAQDLGR